MGKIIETIATFLGIVAGFLAVAGTMYRIARIESAIYEHIDKLRDSLVERILTNSNAIDKYIAIRSEKDEWAEYLRHALDEKIEHKFSRLNDLIKEVRLEIKELKKELE
jgi:phage regulator Rha-like protein